MPCCCLSIDGRPHFQQAQPIFAARKPVFIDKPVAASLVDVVRIFDLAEIQQYPLLLQLRTAVLPEHCWHVE